MPTFKFIEAVSVAGELILSEKEVESGARISIDESIPVANNVAVSLAVDVSQIKGVYILSDQDLLLETNNSSSPDNTLNLSAGVPYTWNEDKPYALAFTTDITSLFATNASSGAARLQIEILKDPTV